MKEIPRKNGVILVDNKDWATLRGYTIFVHRATRGLCANVYVGGAGRGWGRKGRGKWIKLHRFLMGVTDPKVKVDHKNRNPLDNQRSNLRVCNNSQNLANQPKQRNNTTGYKGVVYHKTSGLYVARVGARPITHLGYFRTPIEAARAYDAGARSRWGEFALTNFQ